MAKQLSVASAHECLFVDFLSEEEPKKVSKALQHPGWVDAMQDELNQFAENKVWPLVAAPYVCARYQANPKESYLIDVKRIFRKCTLGSCQFLGGKLVCWSAKKNQSVGISSTEAEYVAAAGCCANILWMKSQPTNYDIIYEKGFDLKGYSNSDYASATWTGKVPQVPIFCDNTSAIAISNNPVLHSRTRHIDIKYRFIRDYILKGDIELHFIPNQYQLADIFTKPLDEPTFKRSIVELESSNPTQILSPPDVIPMEEPVTLDRPESPNLFLPADQVEFDFDQITFTINNEIWVCSPTWGIRRETGITTFRNARRAHYLPHTSMYVLRPSITIVRPWFTTIGYSGEIGAKETLKKIFLPPRVEVDYDKLIWEDIIHKLNKKTREKIVPYLRFISLLLEYMMLNYHNEELIIHLTQVFSVLNWELKPNQPKGPPFTAYMLAICNTDVTVDPKALETSSHYKKKVPQDKKPGAKSELRRKESSKHTSESKAKASNSKISQSNKETQFGEAFTRSPNQYKEYLFEFWYTAKTLKDFKIWVCSPTWGIRRETGITTFRNARRAHYLPHTSGKTGVHDQTSNKDAIILYCLANRVEVDYDKLIWEDIIHKLNKKTREKIVPYLRFISLLLEYMMLDYHNEELTIHLTQVFSVLNWELKPNQPKGPPFTAYMLAICNTDVTVDPKALETSSHYKKKGMDEGTKNYAPGYIFKRTNPSVLVDQTKSIGDELKTAHTNLGTHKESRSDEISKKIKLEDLSDLMKDTRYAFFTPDSPQDEPIIVSDESEEVETKKDEDNHATSHDVLVDTSLEHQKAHVEAKVASLKSRPSYPDINQLTKLLVTSLKPELSKLFTSHDLASSIPSELKELTSKITTLTGEI
nr:hypothetical protein [Tanacetum cinerariifolium]